MRVLESVSALAAGHNVVPQRGLHSRVLVVNGLPVWLDGADASRNDLVKQGNDDLLRKVFRLICCTFCVSAAVELGDPKGSRVLLLAA